MNFFISTSIPYVNAQPHIGFLWEILIADCFARFARRQGQTAFFLTGTDENGLNIAKVAEEQDVATKTFVDQNVTKFQALKGSFNLNLDHFIRTTSSEHKQAVYKFWALCQADIEIGFYRGLYCYSCEAYYDEDETVESNCPVHRQPLEKFEEKNYFFKLTRYLSEVQKLIETEKLKILPESKKHATLNMLKSGRLKDLSISRDKKRSRDWGIPVPADSTQIIYVWFDALVNYISGLGFGSKTEKNFEQFWQNGQVWHFVGKDIFKFHTIYWPAMLLSAGLKLPAVIHVHEFILNEGEKMSKTKGNVVLPADLLAKYEVDVVRYYLLAQDPFADFNFSWSHLKSIYEGELKNEIGNLSGRIFGLLKRTSLEKIALKHNLLQVELNAVTEEYQSSFQKAHFSIGLKKVFSLVKRANQFIEDKKLWEGIQAGRAGPELSTLILLLKNLADFYAPVMPEKSKVITDALALHSNVFFNRHLDFKPLF